MTEFSQPPTTYARGNLYSSQDSQNCQHQIDGIGVGIEIG